MLFKLYIKILFIAIELFLGIYSLVISDSLLVKFLFFSVTAILIAFALTRVINRLLPIDKDYIPEDLENEGI